MLKTHNINIHIQRNCGEIIYIMLLFQIIMPFNCTAYFNSHWNIAFHYNLLWYEDWKFSWIYFILINSSPLPTRFAETVCTEFLTDFENRCNGLRICSDQLLVIVSVYGFHKRRDVGFDLFLELFQRVFEFGQQWKHELRDVGLSGEETAQWVHCPRVRQIIIGRSVCLTWGHWCLFFFGRPSNWLFRLWS